MQEAWITQVRNLTGDYVIKWKSSLKQITENNTAIDSVNGLKVDLYAHQKTTLAAMQDLEKIAHIKVEMGNLIYDYETKAGVLADEVGSGKTICILGIILLNPPLKIKQLRWDININTDVSTLQFSNPSFRFSAGTVTRAFTYLPQTLVFINSSVVTQWKNAIKQHTRLKFLLVDTVVKLERLLELILDGSLARSTTQVVLIKNGKTTRKLNLTDDLNRILEATSHPVTAKTTKKPKQEVFYNVIANLPFGWFRVVIDDFDTCLREDRFGAHNTIQRGLVPSHFTWFVSSTCIKHRMQYVNFYPERNNVETRLKSQMPIDFDIIANDKVLFNLFCIQSCKDHMSRSMALPPIVSYLYKFPDPAGYLKILQDSKIENAETVIEMLNGGAVATAAQAVGIQSEDVADIFQKMLGDQYTGYAEAKRRLEFIETLQSADLPFDEDAEEKYSMDDILRMRMPKYAHDDLDELLKQAKSAQLKIKEKAGMAIQRVKDNISSGDCPICYEPFTNADEKKDARLNADSLPRDASEKQERDISEKQEAEADAEAEAEADAEADSDAKTESETTEEAKYDASEKQEADLVAPSDGDLNEIIDARDVLIFKCCGIVVCGICCFGIVFKEKKLAGRCCNCRADLTIKDTIYIPANFDMKSIVDDKLSYSVGKMKSKSLPANRKIDKIECLIDIIENRPNPNRIRTSADDLDPSRMPAHRKVLVFANYDESLKKTEVALKDRNITHFILNGTPGHISNIVRKFEELDTSGVLLINSLKYCSGLNLQFATDIIFIHAIFNEGLIQQVVGRGQRIGRTYNLQIHNLQYDNELAM